jgi:hypothetical protein
MFNRFCESQMLSSVFPNYMRKYGSCRGHINMRHTVCCIRVLLLKLALEVETHFPNSLTNVYSLT